MCLRQLEGVRILRYAQDDRAVGDSGTARGDVLLRARGFFASLRMTGRRGLCYSERSEESSSFRVDPDAFG